MAAGALCARATRGIRMPSLDARNEIDSPIPERYEQAWKCTIRNMVGSMRAVKGSLGHSPRRDVEN